MFYNENGDLMLLSSLSCDYNYCLSFKTSTFLITYVDVEKCYNFFVHFSNLFVFTYIDKNLGF